MKNTKWILCGPLLAALAVGCGPETKPESGTSPAPAPDQAPSFNCRAWRLLDSGTTASFRGLSAVSDEVVWVSGTGGTWGRTTDGGETWTMRTVPEAEQLDFRDVDAFDDQTAYLMSAGPGELSRIYKTGDGGETWEPLLTNASPEGFWDGMAFWDAERGVLYGDPVDGSFLVLTTEDRGATWSPPAAMPLAVSGEAGFAASGSGIATAAGGHAWFGTGGAAARVFHSADYGRSWTVADTPMHADDGSSGASGIYSLAFSDPSAGFAVGGDYTRPEAVAGNAAHTRDGGLHWASIGGSAPAGYRSAVAYAPGTGGRVLITAGTSGSDFSLDGGETWAALGMGTDLNAISFGTSTCAAWAAGPEGRIARLEEGIATPRAEGR